MIISIRRWRLTINTKYRNRQVSGKHKRNFFFFLGGSQKELFITLRDSLEGSIHKKDCIHQRKLNTQRAILFTIKWLNVHNKGKNKMYLQDGQVIIYKNIIYKVKRTYMFAGRWRIIYRRAEWRGYFHMQRTIYIIKEQMNQWIQNHKR